MDIWGKTPTGRLIRRSNQIIVKNFIPYFGVGCYYSCVN